MKFAKEHSKWPMEKCRNILWTDESKMELYGGTDSRTFVRRPRNEEYRSMYTEKTFKHGGFSIMIWAYFGVVPVHWIETIMDQHVYVDMLQNVMLQYAEDEMPFISVFQQDDDQHHRHYGMASTVSGSQSN